MPAQKGQYLPGRKSCIFIGSFTAESDSKPASIRSFVGGRGGPFMAHFRCICGVNANVLG
jgi:hypothetical protein